MEDKINANISDCPEYISKKTLSVPLDALKKKKKVGVYNELEIGKLMKYYGFQTRKELLNFLRSEHMQY